MRSRASYVNLPIDLAVLPTYKGKTMLLADKTRTTQASRTKPIVVFALLLLAALQLTTATHQFDHAASELGDVCSFCLQLDRLDDISTAENATAAPSNVAFAYDEFTQPLIVVSRLVFSQPRAPPLS